MILAVAVVFILILALMPPTGLSANSDAAEVPRASNSTSGTVTPSATGSSQSQYRSTVLSSQPISYWRLDESVGPIAVDQEHSHPGSYVTSPSLGQPGALQNDSDTAAGFDGSSQFVAVPYAASLNPTIFSVEVWVKPTGGSGTFRGVMASRKYPAGWVLYAGANNTWQFWVNNGTGMATVFGGPVVLNTWTYLVGTYDGATARLYVNGTHVGSKSVTSYHPQTTKPLEIGQGEPGSGFFFPGTIDEPAVYGTSLISSQVQNHYLTGTNSSQFTSTPASTTASSTNTPTAAASATSTPSSTTVSSTNTPSAAVSVTSTPTSTSVSSTNTPSAAVTPSPTSTQTHAVWYVSRNGNNSTGNSWTTAWNELSAIKWSSVNRGDQILLDGGSLPCSSPFNASTTTPYDFPAPKPGQNGSCGMLYNSTLSVGTSGTSALPITISLAQDAGHNGTVVIFGGRTSSLPACTQPTYSPTLSGNQLAEGITIGAHSYVTIDGVKRSGIVIYGALTGIDINSTSAGFITFQNMEIFDNGIFAQGSVGYYSDNPGVWMSGHDLTFSRMLIHDNGQDDIQDESLSGIGQYNLLVTDSWLYFSRENPYQPGWGFNTGNNQPCMHPDGIQTWNGGTQSNLTVQNTIFGPYLGQGFYPADSGSGAKWNNVALNNVLFMNVWYDSINGDGQTTTGWKIQNMTSYKWGRAPDGVTGAHLDALTGSADGVTNSIVENAANDTSLPGITGSGNVYFNTDPIPGGTSTDPQFANVLATGSPHWSDFQTVDLTAQCSSCSGKGSSLHRLQDILDRIDSLNP